MGLPVYMLEPQQQAAFFCRGRFYGEVCAKQFWMQYTFLSTAVALHVRNRSRASLTRSVLIKVGILNDFVSHGPVEARRGGAHRYTKDQEKASCQAHPAVWLDTCAQGRLTPTSDSQHSHRPSLAHVPLPVWLCVCLLQPPPTMFGVCPSPCMSCSLTTWSASCFSAGQRLSSWW